MFTRLRGGELGGRCGRCEYRSVCGGCRARAHALTGDLLGPDDSCAYDPAGDRAVIEPRREVVYGDDAAPGLPWTEEARARLSAVPSFVRGVVSGRVESFARKRGYTAVTAEVMAEVRRGIRLISPGDCLSSYATRCPRPHRATIFRRGRCSPS